MGKLMDGDVIQYFRRCHDQSPVEREIAFCGATGPTSGRLATLSASAYAAIENGEDEIYRLIHLRENGSLINLVGRRRMLNCCTVKVHTANFRGREKALRIAREKQERRVGGLLIMEQM